jgi:hypothetical protein
MLNDLKIKLATNVKISRSVFEEELNDWIKNLTNPLQVELTPGEQGYLANLRKYGVAVIPGYMSRARALAIRDQLMPFKTGNQNKDFTSGAYLRYWQERAYDQGVSRLWHVEKLIPELTRVRFDPLVLRIVSAYIGVPYYSGGLIWQHNTSSNAKTRDFHVDMYNKECKAFVYLDDVNEANGPFTYLIGTHRKWTTRIANLLFGDNTNEKHGLITPNRLGGLAKSEKQIMGPAGTMIIADVRGFHRGAPQHSKDRSVLVNYLYRMPGDRNIDK